MSPDGCLLSPANVSCVEHYRTYLRAELAKLGNLGDAAAFLASGGWPRPHPSLPTSVDDLSRQFEKQGQVDAFVATLNHDDLVELTSCCSRWRNNSVARDLSPRQVTEFVDAPVEAILLNPAEPRLDEAFRRNAWGLVATAHDPEVLDAPEYRRYSAGEPVAFPICLAKPDPTTPGAFRVIDGMHRAIQLARNGEERIPLCVIRDP